MDEHARADQQKPGGIAHKDAVLRTHLIPQLGPKPLDGITTEDVQRLKHHLRGKAVKTVNNILTALNEWQGHVSTTKVAGHRDLATTQRYMHLSPSAVENAIRLLDRPNPGTARGDIVETTAAENGT
jgi:hypothetical protein